MGLAGTYDPLKNTVTIAGNTIVGPFGADSIIKVTRNEDGFTFHPGATGGGARTKNANKSGKIELTLQNSSPSMKTLTALARLDEKTAKGVGAFLVKDNSGDEPTVAEAANVWITKIPDLERAKAIGETTWMFETDEVDIFHTGLTS